MRSHSRQDGARREPRQAQDDSIGVPGLDSERAEDSVGKMFEVQGRNHIRSAATAERVNGGGSKDMPVIGIGELQARNQVLITGYKGIQGVPVHQVSRTLQLRAGQIGPIDEKIPDPLIVNIGGPLRPKQSGDCQMHQKIAKLGRIEDVCVIKSGEAGPAGDQILSS